MNLIAERIDALRKQMVTKGISAFIVPSTDLIRASMCRRIGKAENGYPDSQVPPVLQSSPSLAADFGLIPVIFYKRPTNFKEAVLPYLKTGCRKHLPLPNGWEVY